MKNVNLERYFKLFTNEEAEIYFDNALKKQRIDFVKRAIPDSKFTEYFFEEKDIPFVEHINECLKEKESEETLNTLEKLKKKPFIFEFLTLLLVIITILFLFSL